MTYEQWLTGVPKVITEDALWRVEAYRLALFVFDLSWPDVCKLAPDDRTRSNADQLYRAVGSINANLSEGYSRGSGKDRVRFYEYALGSARESRGWYFGSRHILGEPVVEHRLGVLTSIVRLTCTMIPDQRNIKGVKAAAD